MAARWASVAGRSARADRHRQRAWPAAGAGRAGAASGRRRA